MIACLGHKLRRKNLFDNCLDLRIIGNIRGGVVVGCGCRRLLGKDTFEGTFVDATLLCCLFNDTGRSEYLPGTKGERSPQQCERKYKTHNGEHEASKSIHMLFIV